MLKHVILYENFKNFDISEHSKNDPIPEINRSKDKLGIFIMGSPASGKTYFVKNFIMTRNKNIKYFNSDELSKMITKDPEKRAPGITGLTMNYVKTFLQSAENFVYDRTSNDISSIRELVDLSRELGYKIIFINLFVPYSMVLSQRDKRESNPNRTHTVTSPYLLASFKNSFNLEELYKIKPDSFYVVVRDENSTEYYKYAGGNKMLKRNKDTYSEPIAKNEVLDPLLP
jgi:predicted kinase